MNEEKQIEEMTKAIEQSGMVESTTRCRIIAEDLYYSDYRKQSEWISVEERLPEDYNDVLVMATHGLMDVCFYDKSNKMWIYRSRYIEGSEVTHWMPLPEPPKGE